MAHMYNNIFFWFFLDLGLPFVLYYSVWGQLSSYSHHYRLTFTGVVTGAPSCLGMVFIAFLFNGIVYFPSDYSDKFLVCVLWYMFIEVQIAQWPFGSFSFWDCQVFGVGYFNRGVYETVEYKAWPCDCLYRYWKWLQMFWFFLSGKLEFRLRQHS